MNPCHQKEIPNFESIEVNSINEVFSAVADISEPKDKDMVELGEDRGLINSNNFTSYENNEDEKLCKIHELTSGEVDSTHILDNTLTMRSESKSSLARFAIIKRLIPKNVLSEPFFRATYATS